MRPVGNGRPGTEVIPADWAATHAAVVDKTLEATVLIGPPGSGPAVYNPATHQSATPLGAVAYDGDAEIMVISDTDRLIDAVEQTKPTRRYEVKISYAGSTGVAQGHQVRVVTCKDPDLVGKTLVVDAVERGSQRFSRVLQATLSA